MTSLRCPKFAAAAAFGLTLFSLISPSVQQVDKTLEAGSSGRDVSLAGLRKIQQSQIFGDDDQDFFRRVAYVETRYGTDDDTYADGHYGGIWNISEFHFNVTRNTAVYPGLGGLYVKIEDFFGIDWSAVIWEDLVKPLYSVLAAKLVISNVPVEIPGTIEKQAIFWRDYLNPTGDVEQFIRDVRDMEAEPVCEGLMDIAIVLDGSASIGSFDFTIAKGFVANLIDTFTNGSSVRTGFIVYSDNSTVVFPVENDLSSEEMKTLVTGADHPQGLTYTDLAMLTGIELLNNASERSGVPKILAVFTDGASTDGVASAADIRDNNITSVAVGIGREVNNDELHEIALNDTKNVFTLVEFAELTEFYYRLTTRTCEIPVDPSLNITVNDTLSQNHARYFKWVLPQEGLTISLGVTIGKTVLYYSYTYENPNSAWNDGEVEVDGAMVVYIPPVQEEEALQKSAIASEKGIVYLTVEGLEENNAYTIEAAEGKPNTSTDPPPEGNPPRDNGSIGTININMTTSLLALLLLFVSFQT